MKRLVGVLAVTLVFLLTVSKINYAVSEAGAQILLVEPGARANGMGKAFTSVSNDATACWWNSAGLSFLKGSHITLMHSQLVPSLADDIYYEYAAYTTMIKGWGYFGFNVSYLTYGEQIGMDPQGNQTNVWKSYEIVPGIAYATPLFKNASLGLGFKIVWSDLAPASVTPEGKDGSGYAFAFDIGYLQRDLFIPNLSVGVNIANLGPKIKYIDEEQADPLPRNIRFGVSYKAQFLQLINAAISVEGEKSLVFWTESDKLFSGEGFIGKMGLELGYTDMIYARIGYINDDDGDVKGISWGAGIHYIGISFDFAIIPQAEGLDSVKRYSIGYEF